MARYTGPVTKKSRAVGQSLTGYDKYFEKKKYPPGQHGPSRRKKQKSDYALQLIEKQKAKFTYGVLERQFRNVFHDAHKKSGVTGERITEATTVHTGAQGSTGGITFTRGDTPAPLGTQSFETAEELIATKRVKKVE